MKPELVDATFRKKSSPLASSSYYDEMLGQNLQILGKEEISSILQVRICPISGNVRFGADSCSST